MFVAVCVRARVCARGECVAVCARAMGGYIVVYSGIQVGWDGIWMVSDAGGYVRCLPDGLELFNVEDFEVRRHANSRIFE